MTETPDRVRPGGVTGSTELAAEQETRLIKTLRRGDIVLFIVAAVISVDTIGVMASGGPEGLLWAVFLAGAFLVPSAMIFSETGGAFTRGGRALSVGQVRLRAQLGGDRRRPVLDHQSDLARRLPGLHRLRSLELSMSSASSRAARATTSSS